MKSMAAAIEFGTSKIVTLVGEGNGSGPAQLLGFGVVPYDGYSDGHWNASDEEVEQAIMKSVREAELSSGREIKEIYVGVPGDFIWSKTRSCWTWRASGASRPRTWTTS